MPSAAILANFGWHKPACRQAGSDDDGVSCDTSRRSDAVPDEIGRIPKGFRYFPAPLRSSSSEELKATPSSSRLAQRRKYLKTRLECIIEMGSSIVT